MLKVVGGYVAVFLLAVQPAAAAWSYRSFDPGASIWDDDPSGDYEIEIGCDFNNGPRSLKLWISHADGKRLSDGAKVPVTYIIDGKSIGQTDATVITDSGDVGLQSRETDDLTATDAISAIPDAKSSVRVEFMGKSVTFDATNAVSAGKQLVSYCGD